MTKGMIESFIIPLPELKEQKTIAHILGTLDDKIELNRQMNRTLEAMAQALFKSWFIDFDPVVVNALRAGTPIPEKFAQRAAHYRKRLNSPSPSGRGVGVRARAPKESKLPPGLLQFARKLRKNQTDAEQSLWQLLRGRRFLGLKFRRQHPVKPYVLDFYCHELKLAVEVDGGQHNEADQRRKDAQRTAYLEDQGITVVRCWADSVLRDTAAVLQDLYEKVKQLQAASTAPSPLPPLPEGEGNWPFSEETLLQFPDRFQDSELGPIPEGWNVQSLDDIATFLNGLACQKYPAAPGEPSLPVIKIRELRQGISGNTDRAMTNVPEKYIVHDGDVLFSWSGSLLIDIWTQGKGVLNQHVFKVSSENYPKWFYFHWVDFHLLEFQRIAADKATTMGHIKRHHLADAKVVVPDSDIMKLASVHVSPIFDNKIENAIQARSLAKLRDTLLPKLISGELPVPDAENLLEEAL